MPKNEVCHIGGRRAGALASLFFVAATAANSDAQVVLDGKFGSNAAVAGPNFAITPEMGSTRGNNLFHSFQKFDLQAGDVATFSGPANIQNVLTRVTGPTASSINGTIRSEIAGANFFLINPHGIIFGPNAAIDVSGSFAATSANFLKLADGARFVASLDANDSELSTAPVSAFGFLGSNPGSIAVQQSNLAGAPGQTVSIVGGEITIDGGLVQASGGQINMVSVKSAGESPIDPSTLNRADFRTAFPEQGRIALSNNAKVDTSGEGGGRIVIRGGTLVADNAKIEANTLGAGDGLGIDVAIAGELALLNIGQINSLSLFGFGASGNINVAADSIRMDGAGQVDEFFNPAAQISTSTGDLFMGGGPAKGGDISIKARTISLIHSAQISAATFGEGNAGNIDIETSSLSLDSLLVAPAQITVNSQQLFGPGGNAGDIHIKTDSLQMANGAVMLSSTSGTGAAGKIDIAAKSVRIVAGAVITAGTFGDGSGGNLILTTDTLTIDGRDTLGGGPDFLTGIQAVTTSHFAPAPGGNIQVTANSIDLKNNGSVYTKSIGLGKGGDIEITTRNISLANRSSLSAVGESEGAGGKISLTSSGAINLTGQSAIETSAPLSSGGNIIVNAGSNLTLDDSKISAQAGVKGGDIEILAENLALANHSTISASGEATGDAGKITVTASQTVDLTGQSAIKTSAPGGSGGDILVKATSDITLADSQFTAEAGLNGGNITVLSSGLVYLNDSKFDAQADKTATGFGNGGNITTDPSFLILNNSSLISKSSLGNGGNIDILADYFFASSSIIDATAPFGLPGTVTVTAPDVDLSGVLAALSGAFVDVGALLRPDCGVRLAGNVSSFIVLGRGGLPLAPGGFVPSSGLGAKNEGQ